MSDNEALSSEQADSVRAAIRLLRKIRDCASGLSATQRSGAWNDDQLKEVDRVASTLEGLLDDGKIDSADYSTDVQAKTDGDGIHLNRKFDELGECLSPGEGLAADGLPRRRFRLSLGAV